MVPALLWYPKLFARYSRRTILTTTPTHTPCIRHRRRSCFLPSPYAERLGFALQQLYLQSALPLNLPLSTFNLQLIIGFAPLITHSELRITNYILLFLLFLRTLFMWRSKSPFSKSSAKTICSNTGTVHE